MARSRPTVHSRRELESALPAVFVERIRTLFAAPWGERVLFGLREADRRPVTLRVNTLKADVRTVMEELKRLGLRFERVLWYKDALILKDARKKEMQETSLYSRGLVYLQSLSSMVPPLVLNPQPGEAVLDLTAAPGSKTTQIAALMENTGSLLANELNPIRAQRLEYNLRLQGVTLAEVRVGDGKTVGEERPEAFDRVLLDAPCSGEGLFCLSDPRTYRPWSLPRVHRLASEQRRLLASAVQALKPGGVLVYSTCTLSPEENEAVVDWALRQWPGALAAVPVGLDLPGALPATDWLPRLPAPAAGRDSCQPNPRFLPGVAQAIRILPSRLMEGFFICKLVKRRSTRL